ncbi:MAG: zonular occludens toxin domain-containing protein [Aquabacterium sp.]
MIGGIRDLLLEHEPIDVPVCDPESYKDEWTSYRREPGEAPLDVPHSADNWWLWCMPGDLIVIDECQRLFRPFASGRRIPSFIAKLETHRHYGVDFVLTTQHPQLIHTNVRNLIGRHQHVRRMFGGKSTVIYEWDHCTHPDKVKSASVSYWRHDKKAFELYKSAEVHTKVHSPVPWPLVIAGIGVITFGVLGYRFYEKRLHPPAAPIPVASGAAAMSQAASGPPPQDPKKAAELARFVAAHEPPPAPQDLAYLPDHVAGCFVVGEQCQCVTTTPARLREGYGRFCAAVMAGLFSIPPTRVATPSQAASAPSGLAAQPVATAASGSGGV